MLYNLFMIFCICKNIDEKKIKEILKCSKNYNEFKSLCEKEGLGSACGICLQELYKEYSKNQ